MKTTQEIAADCGLDENQFMLLRATINTHPIEETDIIIGALYRRIEKLEGLIEEIPEQVRPTVEQLERVKKLLLDNCVIMQSRIAAIRAVPEAMDALCAEDVFGGDYAIMLSEDDSELRLAIEAAGGQLVDASKPQADIPGEVPVQDEFGPDAVSAREFKRTL